MSPEQAKGLAVDRRTDVGALGCVLFELVTGRRLFDGPDVSEVLAGVLRAEVDWSLLPSDLPPVPRAFLMRSLHRDPRQRVQDVGDMRLALEVPFDAAVSDAYASRTGRDARPWVLALGIAALVAAAVVGGGVWRLARTTGTPPMVSRMRLTLPANNDFYFNGRHLVAVSPTGRQRGLLRRSGAVDPLAGRAGGPPRRGRGERGPQPLRLARWRMAGVLRGRRVAARTNRGWHAGQDRDGGQPLGRQRAQDGHVYYGQGPGGIWRVSSTGGTPTRVVAVADGEQAHGPQLLPDGERVLFTLLPAGIGSWNRANIVVESLKTQQRVTLVEGGRDARYLTSGHLIYAVNGDAAVDSGKPTRTEKPSQQPDRSADQAPYCRDDA